MMNTHSDDVLALARQDYANAPLCHLSFDAVLAYAKGARVQQSKKHSFKLLYGALALAALVGVIVPTTLHFTNEPGTSTVNPQALREKMIKAGEEYFKDRILPNQTVGIRDDFGVYGKCYVARFSGIGALDTLCCETIGSVVVPSPDGNTAMAFDGTTLYSLKDAFRDLWLNLKQIAEISDKESAIHTWWVGNTYHLDEVHGPAIVLEQKDSWSGTFAASDSLKSVQVTVDPVFKAHKFVLSDFHYDGFSSMEAVASEDPNSKLEYRLLLKQEGTEAITKAIDAIKDLDFVQYARPAVD
jgi:hypothetical protein